MFLKTFLSFVLKNYTVYKAKLFLKSHNEIIFNKKFLVLFFKKSFLMSAYLSSLNNKRTF